MFNILLTSLTSTSSISNEVLLTKELFQRNNLKRTVIARSNISISLYSRCLFYIANIREYYPLMDILFLKFKRVKRVIVQLIAKKEFEKIFNN